MGTDNLQKRYASFLARFLGTFLTVLALGFVGQRIWNNWGSLGRWDAALPVGWVVLVGSSAYAVACILLSIAWFRFLQFFSQSDLDRFTFHRIYARSQIAKYIPGNVFHLASRHVLGSEAGATHASLVGATLFEALGAITCACVVSVMGFAFSPSAARHGSIFFYVLGLGLAFVFPLVARYSAARIPLLTNFNIQNKGYVEYFRLLFLPLLSYCAFFVFAGGILAWLVCIGAGIEDGRNLVWIPAVYAISWVAGFITPGAPAGLGVREAIMVVWLGGVIGESQSLLVALIFRLITVVGDLIFFLTSLIATKKIIHLEKGT